MQAIAVGAALFAIGYGFASAGVWGALTGFIAAVGGGSGFAIAMAESGTGVSVGGVSRTAQRVGGLVAGGGCLAGAYFGGWRLGWLWGIGGYGVGTLVALCVYALTTVKNSQRTRDFASNVSVIPPQSTESKVTSCPDCGAPNRGEEWYCERCGADLTDEGRQLAASEPQKCPACGILNHPGGSYCQHCGAHLQTARKISATAANVAYEARSLTPKVVSVKRGKPGFSAAAVQRLANIIGVPAEELRLWWRKWVHVGLWHSGDWR